jgi:hypothetical protein
VLQQTRGNHPQKTKRILPATAVAPKSATLNCAVQICEIGATWIISRQKARALFQEAVSEQAEAQQSAR